MDAYAPGIERVMKRLYDSLSEKDRRRYAAVEAAKLGHGGVEYVARLLGCDPKTIRQGQSELEGTDDLLETIEKVRSRANPNLHILGVVITMHDKRTALARDIRAQIDKVFGSKVFKTVITKSVRLEESPAYKESIFTFAPDSPGASEYYRLCEEVIDRA